MAPMTTACQHAGEQKRDLKKKNRKKYIIPRFSLWYEVEVTRMSGCVSDANTD